MRYQKRSHLEINLVFKAGYEIWGNATRFACSSKDENRIPGESPRTIKILEQFLNHIDNGRIWK